MKKTLQEYNRDRLVTAVIFVFVLAIICAPLFFQEHLRGFDWEFHMLRIEGIRDGMLSGQFPVKIYPSFYNGYGYASPLFYPDLFLYIPAALSILGLSIIKSYQVFIIIISASCFCTTYYCAKGISNSGYSALITSVVYSLAQYHLQCIYIQYDIGSILAFVFLPFIVYGLYNFIFETFDKPQLFVIGFTGLIYSHLISTFLALLICVVVCLLSLRHILSAPKKLIKLLYTIAAVMCLTSAFWVPMLEQLSTDSFSFHIEPTGSLQQMAIHFTRLFVGYSFLTDASIGTAIFLLCMLRFFIPKSKDHSIKKKIDWFLITGILLSFTATKLFPWNLIQKLLPGIRIIQFPWRLHSFTTLFLALSIGIICEARYRKKNQRLGLELVVILMGISAVFVLWSSIAYSSNINYPYPYILGGSYPNNGYEYIHSGLSKKSIYMYTSGTPKVTDECGNSLKFAKSGVKTTIDYNQKCDYIDVPLLYYKGYSATYTSQDGKLQALDVSYSPKRYTVRVDCSKIQGSGIITIDYPGTPIQHFSLAISVVFLLGIFLFSWITPNIKHVFSD